MKKEEIISYLLDNLSQRLRIGSRKKVSMFAIEKEVIRAFHDINRYQAGGGFQLFSLVIDQLLNDGILEIPRTARVIKKGPKLLREWYWFRNNKELQSWSYDQYVEVSDLLDLSYYRSSPQLQTEDEWRKIKIIHAFIKKRHLRTPISREERSLHLFSWISPWNEKEEKEKWLGSKEGKSFLKRLKVTLDDLVCYPVREPFVYFKNPTVVTVQEVLVLEGLSTFNTCKQLIYEKKWPFECKPELLIFGAGFRIIGNFEYIEDMLSNPGGVNVRYAGDLDPEGYKIFIDFKRTYPKFNIHLATEFYEWSLRHGWSQKTSIITKQKITERQLALFLSEFQVLKTKELLTFLLQNKERIAQEVFNAEALTDCVPIDKTSQV
ncbi:Wadjet anti-phage system protein JetD domain-containing protein [Paenibacillus ottowii]